MIKGIWGNYRSSVELIAATRKFKILGDNRNVLQGTQISLWIKPTDVPNSSFIGVTTLHVSGSLSAHHQYFLAVYRLWYNLCSCDDRLLPGAGWIWSSILLLLFRGPPWEWATKKWPGSV